MERSYKLIQDHMVLVVGHHSADNNHLHPSLRIQVRCMVRNIRHPGTGNMDEYIRQGEDEKQSLLHNVTGPHTFLNMYSIGLRRTRTAHES